MSRFLVAVAAAFLISVGVSEVQAQRGGQSGPPPPGQTGPPPPGQTGTSAPEFDAKSAGAAIALLIGGSLVLLETRRRRRFQRK